MTKDRAYQLAAKAANRTRQLRYIVWSIEEMDAPGQHYHVTDDEGTWTFYDGCEVIAEVEPTSAQE